MDLGLAGPGRTNHTPACTCRRMAKLPNIHLNAHGSVETFDCSVSFCCVRKPSANIKRLQFALFKFRVSLQSVSLDSVAASPALVMFAPLFDQLPGRLRGVRTTMTFQVYLCMHAGVCCPYQTRAGLHECGVSSAGMHRKTACILEARAGVWRAETDYIL